MTKITLTRPCARCPFLLTAPATSGTTRQQAQRIADKLKAGSLHPCVRKRRYTANVAVQGKKWCAGAMGVMENEGIAANNATLDTLGQMDLIDDPTDIRQRATVFASLDAWVGAHPI